MKRAALMLALSLAATVARGQQVLMQNLFSPGMVVLTGTEACVPTGQWTGGSVQCVNLATGAQRTAASGLNFARGVTSSPQGIVFSEANDSVNAVRGVNGAGVIFAVAPPTGSGLPNALPFGFEPYGVHWNNVNYLLSAFGSDGGQGYSVYAMSTNGTLTKIAGNGTWGFSGDGGPATAAQLANPIDAVADSAGNKYIADYNNQRVRLVNQAGTISTFAGTGTIGYSGDGGPATAARLDNPKSLAVGCNGEVYIACRGQGLGGNVRVVRNGIINTLLSPADLSGSDAFGIATDCQSIYVVLPSVNGAGQLRKYALPGVPTFTPTAPPQPTATPSAPPIKTVQCSCVGADLFCPNVCGQ